MSAILDPVAMEDEQRRLDCEREDAAIQADLAEDANKAQRRREVQDQATVEAEAMYFRSRGWM